MKLVGLTGGIACGKTAVTKLLLRHFGISVIDCDLIAHDMGTWGYARVTRSFRDQLDIILWEDGELNRPALAQLIFSDATARRKLNAATHTPVLLGIIRQVALHWVTFKGVAVIDMPLLFETGAWKITRLFGGNVLVRCSPGVQLDRLMQREGLDKATAEARIASSAWMPMERKEALADDIIDNNGSLEDLKEQVARVVRRLQRHAWLHRALLSPAGLGVAVFALMRAFS